jgi:hypothetical protein
MVREGRVFRALAGLPRFGANYSVTAYEVGAQVTSASSGATVTVRAGHGFAAGDKWMLSTGLGFSGSNTITSVGATTLNLPVSISVSQGDILVNLAADTGTSTPNYDGAGLTIYTDMAYGSAAVNNTVAADPNGRYTYYHRGIPRWEWVRSGSTPIALYQDTGPFGVDGPATSTDNALVRWDGADGSATQDSGVIVDDSDNVSGIATLDTTGDVTVGGDLAVTNGASVGGGFAVTGQTNLNGAGTSLVVAHGATVGGAMTVTGAVTCSANLEVDTTSVFVGAATFESYAIRSVAAAVTASTTQTQGQSPLTKDVNNVSVCANANDTVTLPAASAGMQIVIINNGAQTLKIYPASGDNLGAGVNTSTTLAAGSNTRFTAIDSTNWEVI